MASGLITSWETEGETVETVRDFIFLGSKITADSDTAKKFKDAWLLERKAMINLDSIFKSRDITLPRYHKGLPSQGYCFSSGHVWM